MVFNVAMILYYNCPFTHQALVYMYIAMCVVAIV